MNKQREIGMVFKWIFFVLGLITAFCGGFFEIKVLLIVSASSFIVCFILELVYMGEGA